MIITSTENRQVKSLSELVRKARARREQGLFVAEGRKLYLEAPVPWIVQTYATEAAREQLREQGLLKDEPILLSDQVFRSVSDTKTPQGILCLLRQPHYRMEDLLSPAGGGKGRPGRETLLLVLERIQDPGNLGTILRMAEGAGATGVLMSSDCADPFSPKVVRATMGSVFRMPFVCTETLREDMRLLQEQGVSLSAACLEGSVPYDACDYTGPCGFIIGNEGNGLTRETIEAADARIHIPMCGKVESLNASIAASILAYEALRQRSRCGET